MRRVRCSSFFDLERRRVDGRRPPVGPARHVRRGGLEVVLAQKRVRGGSTVIGDGSRPSSSGLRRVRGCVHECLDPHFFFTSSAVRARSPGGRPGAYAEPQSQVDYAWRSMTKPTSPTTGSRSCGTQRQRHRRHDQRVGHDLVQRRQRQKVTPMSRQKMRQYRSRQIHRLMGPPYRVQRHPPSPTHLLSK